MSNWIKSYHEEEQVFDAWKISEAEQTFYDTMKGFDFNEKQSLDCKFTSDHNIWNAHPTCNQLLMDNKMDEHRNEDYKISSSIKTLWNDASQNKPTTYMNQTAILQNAAAEQIKNIKQAPQSEYVKHVTALGTGILEQSVNKFNTDNAAAYKYNGNSLKGRAITARNVNQNDYIKTIGIENGNISNTCIPSPVSLLSQRETVLSPNIQETSQSFLRSLKLIVQNGFLDSKILNEPISPDTHDLLQMLIFYVMEYSRTKTYAISCDNNPALCADINNITYKINLIRNEIIKCQSQHIEQTRIRHEIYQSFTTLPKKQMCNVSPTTFNQYDIPMTIEGNTRRNQIANRIDSVPQNQRFTQRQFDQFPQQKSVNSTSGKIIFSPKAKNVENRFFFDQNNYEYLRKDSRLFGNPNSNIN